MELGPFGVWTTFHGIGAENAAEAARLAESLGYGTFWLGGSPRLSALAPLLEATDTLVLATGIVNVWAYDPAELAAEYARLARAYGDRILVGIGIGHPEATSAYAQPLETMRGFLDGLDEAGPTPPREHRCLAALAPGMLDLAAERSLGTHTYFVPVAHTSAARAQLGDGPLLAPELAFVLDADEARGRERARSFAARYLGLGNYTRNLLRHGFEAEDVAGGGSDELVDAVVPHGDPGTIAAVARAHLDAGADHVALQAVGETGIPRESWTAVADAIFRQGAARLQG